MAHQDIDEKLMKATGRIDIQAVRECLKSGADPNYRTFKDEDEPNGYIQPTTPLRSVVFSISSCTLTDKDLETLKSIAQTLLDHGADPQPAIEIAEWRYGKYTPKKEPHSSSPRSVLFTEILDLIHAASPQQQ